MIRAQNTESIIASIFAKMDGEPHQNIGRTTKMQRRVIRAGSIILFVLFCVFQNCIDNYTMWGMSMAAARGQKLYTDINAIVTPLSLYWGMLPCYISSSYYAYFLSIMLPTYIVHTLCLYSIYRHLGIGSWKLTIILLLSLFTCPGLCPLSTYNFICVVLLELCVLVLMESKSGWKQGILIGLFCFFSLDTKQSIGIVQMIWCITAMLVKAIVSRGGKRAKKAFAHETEALLLVVLTGCALQTAVLYSAGELADFIAMMKGLRAFACVSTNQLGGIAAICMSAFVPIFSQILRRPKLLYLISANLCGIAFLISGVGNTHLMLGYALWIYASLAVIGTFSLAECKQYMYLRCMSFILMATVMVPYCTIYYLQPSDHDRLSYVEGYSDAVNAYRYAHQDAVFIDLDMGFASYANTQAGRPFEKYYDVLALGNLADNDMSTLLKASDADYYLLMDERSYRYFQRDHTTIVLLESMPIVDTIRTEQGLEIYVLENTYKQSE